MTLPTAQQMNALSKLIVDHDKVTRGEWYTFKGMMQSLEASTGDIAGAAVSAGAQRVVTVGAAAAGITTGVAFVSFGAVLAPWIAVADVARRSTDIFDLYDLKEHADGTRRGSADVRYVCLCGKCAGNIQYVIDKKERNAARVAIGVGTLGVSAVFTSGWSVAKSFQSGRPKEMTSRALVESARGGCTVAMATIFLMSGNWQFLRGGNAGTMRRAIAIITSSDGWKVLKDNW